MSEELEIITLVDENDEGEDFELIMTFEHEEKVYVALTPVELEEGDEEEAPVVLLERIDKDGDISYAPIADEDEEEAAFNTFLSLMEED